MKKIDLIQGSQEWKDYRKDKIGASDCPVIMGCGYKTPLQLWKEKATGAESFVTPSMQRGTDLEPLIRNTINDGRYCIFQSAVFESETHPFMMCSVDGIDETGSVIEIKTCSEEVFEAFKLGVLNDRWFWQCQHIMAVISGASVALYASPDGSRMAYRIVERDDTAIKDLIAKEEEFHKCMKEWTPPNGELPEKDDPKIVAIMEMIREAKESIKHWETRYKELKEAAVEYGGGEEFQCAGFRCCRTIKPGAVNYKAIPQLEGVDLDAYRGKPIEYWTVS